MHMATAQHMNILCGVMFPLSQPLESVWMSIFVVYRDKTPAIRRTLETGTEQRPAKSFAPGISARFVGIEEPLFVRQYFTHFTGASKRYFCASISLPLVTMRCSTFNRCAMDSVPRHCSAFIIIERARAYN